MKKKFLYKIAVRLKIWLWPFLPIRWVLKCTKAVIPSKKFKLRNTYRVQSIEKPNHSQRYIICADLGDIYGGLGCCLSTLAPCWNYARQTNRTLVIDWRGNPYTRHDPEINLFPLLFDLPSEDELGVPCIADDSLSDFEFPQPVLGPSETLHQSWGPDKFPSDGLHPVFFRHIINYCVDVNFPTLLPGLTAIFGVGKYQKKLNRESVRFFYRSLKPKQLWREKIQKFYDENMKDIPIIGIHIRHGNGEENFENSFVTRKTHDFDNYVDEISKIIIKHGAIHYKNKFKLFLCTDSEIAVTAFKRKFPDLISQDVWRPPSNAGVYSELGDKHPNGQEHIAGEALVDMYLLAKCDSVLVPKNTEFTAMVKYIMEKSNSIFLNTRNMARL